MKRSSAKAERHASQVETSAAPLPQGVRLVGIGASAGGLEALRELMDSLPESHELSYVIAQHVSPTHVSMLMNLLAPRTSLAIMDLSDEQAPEAGTVYITPPNKDVVLKNGLLRLTEPLQTIGPKPSVNHFFRSLADELGEKAIGVILSGTGSDGAAGLRAIKAAGGITIAQEPDSAKYDGMPKAAIHTGSVDLTLRPAEIGPTLDRLITQRQGLLAILAEEPRTDEYTQIRSLVRVSTAFRLSDYKPAMVQRRIARRMSILGIDSLKAYVEHLRTNKDEAQSLVRDTFISVTAFFRDTEPFLSLERVIHDIVRRQTERAVIRCWVPGCASGEEAYSIAILFEEALREQDRGDLQYVIFASDLDDEALEHARSALYPLSELENMPKALRDRYTEVIGGYHRLLKSVRSRLVFARQNVIEDPPFARLDLISCRNLLIYLNPPVQQRVLEVFHYSLNTGGHLFLGKSESAEAHRNLFKAVDGRARIYTRLEGHVPYALPVGQGMPRALSAKADAARNVAASTDLISMRTLEDLAERYAPPSLVINEADNVVHFHGNLKPYLNFPKGRADMYLFDLLETGIRTELRALVYRCRRDMQTIEGSAWTHNIDGQPHLVTPVVSPLEPGHRQLFLISFQAALALEGKPATERIGTDERDSLIISELEQELANTRTHLNIVVEELETSNEELQSLNEELQSTNEELQTSNEELQSTNEELLTINEELQVKSAELEATANDLTNVKQSLAFPLIVVDTSLRITQANTACDDIVASDRPLERSSLDSVRWRLEVPGLIGHVRRVIQDGNSHYQDTLLTEDGTVYGLNVMPYRRPSGEVDGAVLLFRNVSAQHDAEEALKQSNERFDLAVRGSSDGLWDWDIASGRMYLAPRFKEILGHRDDEMESSLDAWSSRLHPDDREATLAALDACVKNRALYDVTYRLRHKGGDYVWIRSRGQTVRDSSGTAVRMAGSISDISPLKEAEQALRVSEQRVRLMTANVKDYAIIMLDSQGRVTSWNEGAQRITGYEQGEIIGQSMAIFQSSEGLAAGHSALLLKQAQAEGWVEDQGWRIRKDGSRFYADVVLTALSDDAGSLIGFAKITRDITARRMAERALRESEERNRTLIENAPDPILVTSEAGVIEQSNLASERLFGYDCNELIGRNVSVLVPSPHREAHDDYLAKYLATGESRIIGIGREVQALRKDGSEITIHMNVGIQRLADGRRRFVGFARDLTERVRAETAIRDSQQKFHQAMKHAPIGMALVAPDGRFVEVNPALCRIVGYDEKELLALDFQTITYREDLGSDLNYLRQALAGERETYQMDKRYVHKDGHTVWVQLNVALVRDEAGAPRYFISQIQDVTDQRHTEAELRLAASVFANTLDAIFITAPDCTILNVNRAFQRITGYSSEEAIGHSIRILYSGRHNAAFYREMWESINETGGWQGEIWDRHKDGRLIPLWLSISTLFNEKNEVERYIATMYDISEQKTSQEHINRLAHYDTLTGLPNRTLFMDRLEHALTRARRQGCGMALMFIDLDRFKDVNDSYGHPAGDELLRCVADRLRRMTRESDTVARLSGDEFTVLLEDTSDLNGVRITAQRIVTALTEPVDLQGRQFFISASIGISLFPEDGSTTETLVKNADLAMYRSKELGRNQYHFYTEEMSNRVEERIVLHNDLRRALDQQEISVHYQPIFEVATKQCVGAEALARWQHPEKGWITPARFIVAAEEDNLIHPLGENVLHTACRQMVCWLDEGVSLEFLAVNVSGKQIMRGDFVNVARRVLEATSCPADRIVLELTESFLMHESEGAIALLNNLRDLGFGIAIDDFGTGYSSLAHLKRLPVTRLKLDQSFVRDIPGDGNDTAIARAILRLGDTLGLEVVAEGVETEEQHRFLLSEGCALSQGYLYAKPMPVAEFAAQMGNGQLLRRRGSRP